MSDHQADYPIATMCRVLGVSSSGYHAWVKRRPSQRAETDAVLIAAIRVAHAASRGTYGAPRVHAELVAKGIRVGCKRVARLMTQAGLAGVSRRKFVVTTVKDGGRQAPDLVERNFTAEAPDRLWVADITYIPTWAGFLYLAVVLDVFSRRIVGWSMATTLAKQLVLDALNMALSTRGCCGRSRYVAGCRNKTVPKGGRHATSDVSAISEAVVRPVSLICGARGDRASSRARLLRAGGCTPARTNSLNDLAGVAAQRRDPKR